MNKRILSLFVLGAAFFSVQAQQDKGGISSEMLDQIRQSYQGTSADKALRNAIGNNDIRKLALNQENMTGMDTHFSIKVDSKGITDQKSSGRCWLFTGLNVMRAKAIAKYGLGSFEFAMAFIFAIVVCKDAMGVRLETGRQAVIINDIVEAFNSLASEKLPEAKLKEFVGHTPLQVIAGILLGVANTFIMYYCVL